MLRKDVEDDLITLPAMSRMLRSDPQDAQHMELNNHQTSDQRLAPLPLAPPEDVAPVKVPSANHN